jgi:CDP-diglyceride synthetase
LTSTFAYLVGKSIGKPYKLLSISQKTIEEFIGGVVLPFLGF